MDETRLDRIKTVLRVTSGNFLEMYDFFLFGIYARQIGQTFFPSDDPYASLMATFLSFAAGFAMRPIGALALGPYIDRIGRRKGLILTLSIMACGTILIAFVPTTGVSFPMPGWSVAFRPRKPSNWQRPSVRPPRFTIPSLRPKTTFRDRQLELALSAVRARIENN